MPKASSFADVVEDWESLLIATEEHAQEMPEAERHRTALAEHLVLTRQLKAARDSAVAAKQQATQDFQAAVTQGRELAIRCAARYGRPSVRSPSASCSSASPRSASGAGTTPRARPRRRPGPVTTWRARSTSRGRARGVRARPSLFLDN